MAVTAAKEIAHVGSELLQNYQSLQKSFNQYMQAIDTLIWSSKKAFPKAKAHGDDLRELAAKSAQILERHKKCIRELSSLVTKTSAYSNEEKDKLKSMLNKFQRDEKKIRKQCSKGLKMSKSDQIERESIRSLSSVDNSTSNSTTKQQEMVGTVTGKNGSLSFNEASAQPPVDDHYSNNTVLDLMDYRPVEPETKLSNGKRPPVGGRWVLPPLQNFKPHNHVDAMYAPETTPADRPQPPTAQAQNGSKCQDKT
ncbi:unnamed protein product [Angiostrongylus costaricensis]|uniref:ING domain-containing protein n=1 Tax=Angiostrongylus costaricensis TaxID=334426 RepID=A0A0R3PRZ5_ANGCS|nr:unnamed protein product [Angiostrongylus costaricensis]